MVLVKFVLGERIFCIIDLHAKHEWLKALSVLLVTSIGLLLGELHVFLPFMIDNAMTALGFFYIGYCLKRTRILYPNSMDKYNLLFVVGFYMIAVAIDRLFDNSHFELSINRVYGNKLMVYIVAVSSVMAILFLCKIIKRLPFVSYFGRYSIIPLCVHHLVYRPVKVLINYLCPSHLSEYQGLLLAVATLLVCWAMIPVCRKLIPYFIAQKDLLEYDSKQHKIHFNVEKESICIKTR